MDENEKIIKAIENSGYDLEFYIYNLLRAHHWQVINNRYYLDDVKGVEREVDAIAYKVKQDTEEDILFYTVLIISCKKSKESIWAFLTHEIEENDPNYEFCPIENFSTDKRLALMIRKEKGQITQAILNNPSVKEIFSTQHKIFSFQMINEKSYKVEDHSNIYNSIISIIKALEYEKNKRKIKREPVFYNFNLLSIFEGTMKEVFFKDGEKTISDINEIKYINRHIIDKIENFYRVHFINKLIIAEKIKLYNNLFNLNCGLYPTLIASYYDHIFEDDEKVQIFWEQFTSEVLWWINFELSTKGEIKKLNYSYSKNKLLLQVVGGSSLVDTLNENTRINLLIKRYLKMFFRYDGEFMFEDELPF